MSDDGRLPPAIVVILYRDYSIYSYYSDYRDYRDYRDLLLSFS